MLACLQRAKEATDSAAAYMEWLLERSLSRAIEQKINKTAPAIPTVLQRTSPEGSEKLKISLFPIHEVTCEALKKCAMGESVSSQKMDWEGLWHQCIGCIRCRRQPFCFPIKIWLAPNFRAKVCKIPLTSLHTEDNLMAPENENMHASGGEPSKGHPLVSNEPLNHESGTPTMLDKAIYAADKDTPTKCNGASLSWLDSISNISFGALLSQASATQETSQGHLLPKTIFHQIPNCDTFDAEIAAYTAQQHGTCISSEVSSIFYAEQTHHTFPHQQTSLSNKEILPSSKDYPCMPDNQNMETNLMKFHNMTVWISDCAHINCYEPGTCIRTEAVYCP